MRLSCTYGLRHRRQTALGWACVLGATAVVLPAGAAMAAVPVKVVDDGAGDGAGPDLAFNANNEAVIVYRHSTRHTLNLVRTGCASSQVLTLDGGSGNGTSTFTATLGSYSQVTTLTYVAGQIDWAASSSEISLNGTLDGPLAYGVSMTAHATFDSADTTGPLPPDYPPWGGTATSGQWGGISDATLSLSGPVATSEPLDGRWSEGFESGQPDTPGDMVHAASWDGQALGTQWEITGVALDSVSLTQDTVDESGNGTKVYQRTYVGGQLKLSGALWNDANTWPSLAVDTTQAAHISHTRASSLLFTDAAFVGGPDPVTITIPGISGAMAPVMAMDSVGRPCIAYYATAEVWLVKFDISSGSWLTEAIPGPSPLAPPSQSCPISIQVNSQNEPVVAYVTTAPYRIVLATLTEGGWVMRYETITAGPANLSLALDLDVPHVACVASGVVRVYRFHALGVSVETAVDGTMTLSPHSLRIDAGGRKRLAYWDPSAHAYCVSLNDYGWLKTVIEQVPTPSSRPTCSLAIDPQNRWAMAYVDGTGRLKLAGPAVLSPTAGDADCDGIPDGTDNCSQWANPLQEDFDRDGLGDTCDNCPSTANQDQSDIDGDTIGDVCDPDIDGDGLLNVQDNCPSISNLDQADADGDQVGDPCDQCSGSALGSPVDEEGCPPIVLGDLNRDGDIDAADAELFAQCATGPDLSIDTGCWAGLSGSPPPPDYDGDSDVDMDDFGTFQACYSGAGVALDPYCASGGPAI